MVLYFNIEILIKGIKTILPFFFYSSQLKLRNFLRKLHKIH